MLQGLVVALAAGAIAGSPPPATPDLTAGLTARQLLGQHMLFWFSGSSPSPALVHRIRRGEVAGVVLVGENFRSLPALRRALRRLQRIPRPPRLDAPLLVMADQEGGQVRRLPGPPHAPAELGARGDPRLVARDARATARSLCAMGINVNLAPVLDLGRPGSFQRQRQRAYSERPRLVGRLGSAAIGALAQGGIAATAKHFPGVGALATNEDVAQPPVRLSRRQLRTLDEAPFAAAVRAGVRVVMTSTAIYSAFSRVPAMVSGAIVKGELRRRLGFHGVTMTDDLQVTAVTAFGTAEQLGRRALRAGNDLLLYGSAAPEETGPAVLDALLADQRAGLLRGSGLRGGARRVLALRDSLRPGRGGCPVR